MLKRLKRQRLSSSTRSGFSLVELTIVMGVIGVLVSAVWYAASSARETQRQNDAYTEIQTTQQNILQMMGGRVFSMNYTAPTQYTPIAIANHFIQTAYVDASDNTQANNPWSTDGFVVWVQNPASSPFFGQTYFNEVNLHTFRISLYKTSVQGCVSTLLKMTQCHPGTTGCPLVVYTNLTAAACFPNQTNCPSATPTFNPAGTNIGWQSVGLNVATAMCAQNPAGGGSVEFDFSL